MPAIIVRKFDGLNYMKENNGKRIPALVLNEKLKS
jgi:hypothetical protein